MRDGKRVCGMERGCDMGAAGPGWRGDVQGWGGGVRGWQGGCDMGVAGMCGDAEEATGRGVCGESVRLEAWGLRCACGHLEELCTPGGAVHT